ncbi:hypothetical protein B0H11DRAFT_1971126 [Mycena galericulata]|nr:hypothetical protein B0H11DRAFT_1971126 [Mycena galericulata]
MPGRTTVTCSRTPMSPYTVFNGWLSTTTAGTKPSVVQSQSGSFVLPNEIWTQIFQEPSLQHRDLFAVFTCCHHFNELVLPLILCNAGTLRSDLTSGSVDIPSHVVTTLNLASCLPTIGRMTCTFDIRGDSRAPRDFVALKDLLCRVPSLTHLRLNFLGDLLSAYKSDLVPLTPQRMVTESFCDLLSSLPNDPDAPVVFVGTEIFTSRAADIRSWQLDKYMFTNPSPSEGFLGRFAHFPQFRKPQRNPLRNKTSVKLHNGLHASVFPFISISSVDVRHIQGPFSPDFASWTMVTLNGGSSHWPNALNLSAPLAAEEWAGILPLLSFPNLPLIRMDPTDDLHEAHNIPSDVLDAFLSRHPTITRMYYYPDPLTLPDSTPSPTAFLPRMLNLTATSRALHLFRSPESAFPNHYTPPHAFLPRMRNITTTARCALHLLRSPEDVFPNLSVLRITGTQDSHVITDALRLLSRHRGNNKLILEISTGSWMVGGPADAAVVRRLHRVDTVILCRFTDLVDPETILLWLSLFPALRRVGLQGCLHDNFSQEEQREFLSRARLNLPNSIELLISTYEADATRG